MELVLVRSEKRITRIKKLMSSLNDRLDENPDPSLLASLVSYRMPFGQHKGKLLTELPMSYLEWFAREGFPKGKLGMLLATLYEIRLNGLEYLLRGLKAPE